MTADDPRPEDPAHIAAGTISVPLSLSSLNVADGAAIADGAITASVIDTMPARIWQAVAAERRRAEAKHGVQSLPLGTGGDYARMQADLARVACDEAFKAGKGTWRHIIAEEAYEAFAESDPQEFVTEAVQAIGTLYAAIADTMRAHPDVTLT